LFKVYPCPPATPTTTHGEARLIQLSRSEPWLKNFLKWQETLLLVSCILDDIEGFKWCENLIHVATFITELPHFKT